MFSKKVSIFEGIPNRLYREKERRTREAKPGIDLISGHVHTQGILYPPTILKRGFQQAIPHTTHYKPDPQGQLPARLAIQHFYDREGIVLPENQIMLTPGTSLSYAYLFHLLTNPGDEILCPTPTYPLFDSIAALCNVRIVSYRLVPKDRWTIDFNHLTSKITPKTRALVLISPHNPTGAVATQQEIDQLISIAKQHSLPIISDEVFSPFLFTTSRLPRPADTDDLPLVFTLNGISKMLALPGIKIGWIGLSGEVDRVNKALRMVKGISDSFLPVNELAQFALPILLEKGKPFMKSYQRHITRRFERVNDVLMQAPAFSFIAPEGGFYIAVEIKNARWNDEKFALELFRQENILVHPGHFYDLPPRHFVFSFLGRPVPNALKRLQLFDLG